jgi:hypothetical protein
MLARSLQPVVRGAALAAALGCALFATGCPAKGKPVSKMDWRAELAAYFDDQLDLVRVRVKFSGKWNRDFEEKYLGRVGYSDAIVVGTVKTLYYDTRWDKTRGLIYDFEVKDLVKGGVGDDKLLSLAVAEGELTGDSASTHEEEIVGHQFFLYLKWENVDEHKFHWHLSPYSPDAEKEVRSLMKSAEKGDKSTGGMKDIDATPTGEPPAESGPTS